MTRWRRYQLSTFSQPVDAIAERTAQLVNEVIAQPDRPAVNDLLSGELIVRRSTIGQSAA